MTAERLDSTVFDLRSVRNWTSVEKIRRASWCSGSPGVIEDIGDVDKYRVTYAYAILKKEYGQDYM